MKKLNSFVLAGLLIMVAHGSALAGHDHPAGTPAHEDKVKVYQCPMDKYTVSRDCPLCGMKMEEKEMTSADAQAAIDKAKEQMRNRS
jgi:transposase-like protein